MTKLPAKIPTDRAEFPDFYLARQWAHDNVNGFPAWTVEETAPFTFVVALIPNDLYLSNEDVESGFGDPFNGGTRSEPANSDEEPDQLAPGD